MSSEKQNPTQNPQDTLETILSLLERMSRFNKRSCNFHLHAMLQHEGLMEAVISIAAEGKREREALRARIAELEALMERQHERG